MKIHRARDGRVIFKNAATCGRLLHSTPYCEYVRLDIEAGAVLESHRLPMPVSFYLIDGRAELTTPAGSFHLEKDDLIEIEAGLDRQWRNTGSDRLQLLVIKHLDG